MLASDFHTLFNHFTIALINVGIIFELVAFMFKNDGMKRYSWISIRLGFAFGLVSLATGFFSESSIAIKAEAVRVLSYHELLSIALMVVLGIAVLLRVLMQDRFDNTESGALLRGGYLVLIVATIFLTGVSGFLGMQMVYSYGVNVKLHSLRLGRLRKGRQRQGCKRLGPIQCERTKPTACKRIPL
jgi:uncharacterized membrane protein